MIAKQIEEHQAAVAFAVAEKDEEHKQELKKQAEACKQAMEAGKDEAYTEALTTQSEEHKAAAETAVAAKDREHKQALAKLADDHVQAVKSAVAAKEKAHQQVITKLIEEHKQDLKVAVAASFLCFSSLGNSLFTCARVLQLQKLQLEVR